jgi:hypothetical protein
MEYESKLRRADFIITIGFYDQASLNNVYLSQTPYTSGTYYGFFHDIKSGGGKRRTKKSKHTIHKKRTLTKRHIHKRNTKRKLRKAHRKTLRNKHR